MIHCFLRLLIAFSNGVVILPVTFSSPSLDCEKNRPRNDFIQFVQCHYLRNWNDTLVSISSGSHLVGFKRKELSMKQLNQSAQRIEEWRDAFFFFILWIEIANSRGEREHLNRVTFQHVFGLWHQ